MPTSIIMHGARGRMGQRILSLALDDSERFTVAGGVDLEAGSLRDLGLPCDAPIHDHLPVAPGQVVIDFSHADAAPGVIAHCAEHGMPLVLATTGLDPAGLENQLTPAATKTALLWAPNMSLGVNLVFAVAARIAQTLGLDYDVEIVEAHHHHKVDAPSGTAYGIADAIARATGRGRSDMVHGREGMVGARPRGEIGMHALRMGDVVGEHTAYFCGNGERIALSHMAHTRDIFAAGALRAAAWLDGRDPGRYGMDDVLGL
jgi:4-hydroxy-tetrahydrodipicolinate reductase